MVKCLLCIEAPAKISMGIGPVVLVLVAVCVRIFVIQAINIIFSKAVYHCKSFCIHVLTSVCAAVKLEVQPNNHHQFAFN